MAKMGRPSKRTPEVERAILTGLAEGRALKDVCASIPGGPTPITVRSWVAADPEFSTLFARARRDGAAVHAEDIIGIADEIKGGDANAINAAKLRVDARKWYASRVIPHEYGDRAAVELSGPAGGPVQFESIVDLVKRVAQEDDGKDGAK